MRNVRFKSLACVALAALFLGSQAPLARTAAQGKSAQGKSKAADSDGTQGKQKLPRKALGRVPTYFGQVGLSGTQKEKIYAFQNEYRDRISDLQKQIRELESRRDADVESVLTSDQKKQVEELRAAARKRAAERRLKKKST